MQPCSSKTLCMFLSACGEGTGKSSPRVGVAQLLTPTQQAPP